MRLFHDLAALVRPPIECPAHGLRGHSFQQIRQDITPTGGRNDDAIALGFNLHARALANAGAPSDVLRDPHPRLLPQRATCTFTETLHILVGYTWDIASGMQERGARSGQ